MIRNRIRLTTEAKARHVLPHPHNPRTHGEDQRASVATLLNDFGFVDHFKAFELPDDFEGVNVDHYTIWRDQYGMNPLMLWDGHLRLDDCDPNQILPLSVVDLTPDEAVALMASFDWTTTLAGYDADAMRKIFEISEPSDRLADLWRSQADDLMLFGDASDEGAETPFGEFSDADGGLGDEKTTDFAPFQLGDYRGKVERSVYVAFERQYRQVQKEQDAPMLSDVLVAWLNLNVTIGIDPASDVSKSVTAVSDGETLQIASLETPPVVVEHECPRVVKSTQAPAPFIVKVVRDDLLPGGTKRRAVESFFRFNAAAEIVYGGVNIYGKAQEALAFAARDHGKKATLFVAKRKLKHAHTLSAIEAGATVIEVPNGMLTVTEKRARDYAEKEDFRAIFPCGFVHPEIIDEIARVASQIETPGRFWCVAASGCLARGLMKAWPDAVPLLVLTGKTLDEELKTLVAEHGGQFWVAPQKYNQKAKKLPPYPSLLEYDAKIWQFVLLHGEPGDLIWNVS